MNTKLFTSLRNAAKLPLSLGILVVMLVAAVSPAYAADVQIQSVSVGGQSGPVTYGSATDVSYTVTVTCQGKGTGANFPLSAGGLPSGVTASFLPSGLYFPNGCGDPPYQQTSLMTLHTTAGAQAGIFTFSAIAGGQSGQGSLTVDGIQVTITGFNVYPKQYDGGTIANPDLSGITVSPSLPVGISLNTDHVFASYDNKNVGISHFVQASGFYLQGTGSTNYDLTQPSINDGEIIKRDLNIDYFPAATKTYDATRASQLTFSTDALAADIANITISGTGSYDSKNVGTHKLVSLSVDAITLTGSAAGNYNPVVTSASKYADITPADLIVNAVTDSKPYDGTSASSGVVQVLGLKGSGLTADTASFTQSFNSAAVGADKTLTPSGTVSDGNGGNNYTIHLNTASGAINARTVKIQADAKSKVFGESDPALTYQFLDGTSLASGDSFTGAISRVAGENVGHYGIGQGTLALSSNYNLVFTGGDFEVTKRPVASVNPESYTIGILDPDPAFAYSYGIGDLASGDTLASIDVPPVCGVSVPHAAAGDYTITCSEASDSNYDFSSTVYNTATLTRTAAPVSTVTFYSQGVNDGWILESGPTTNAGGTKNNKATTLRVGDDALNQQYKSILSFDTSSLPDSGFTITDVKLMVMQQKLVGGTKIFKALKSFVVDMNKPSFKKLTLELGDFKVKPPVLTGKLAAGTFVTTPVSGWYSVDLLSAQQYLNLGGTTQFRLRFAKGDNGDLKANYLSLWSGNSANAPKLVITYTIP